MQIPPIRHSSPPTQTDLAHARHVVREHLAPTPVVAMNGYPGCMLKLESMQPTGAFKVRGALVAAAALQPGRRLLTASAGNHALGMAYAARTLGVSVSVVVARDASPRKIDILLQEPVELILHGHGYDEAERHAIDLANQDRVGTELISGYNDPRIIAGNATIVDEIVAQAPPNRPLRIVAPGGGGGLLSGIALRASELTSAQRSISVLGVEAATSPALSTAFHAGHTVTVDVGETLADGLAGNIEPGSVTVAILRAHVSGIVQVTEAGLRSTIRHLVLDQGLVAEGAGATAIAAIRSGAAPPFDGVTVAILSGRNIALPVLADILSRPTDVPIPMPAAITIP